MSKVMVVSYNSIGEFPAGRFAMGNAVAYSGTQDYVDYAMASLAAAATGSLELAASACNAQKRAAEAILSRLQEEMAEDLQNVEVVYVYVGLSAMKGALAFIQSLQEMKKTVHMVACDCDRAAKVDFARRLGVDVIWSECGGKIECEEIFKKAATL